MNYFELNMALLKEKDPKLFERVKHVEVEELPPGKIETTIVDPRTKLTEINTLVILGFGWGIHVEEVLKKTTEKTFILVIDHSLATFKTVLHKRDLSTILKTPRVILSIEEDPTHAVRYRIDQYYRVSTIPDITIAEYKPVTALKPEFYQEVRKYLNEAALIATQNLATLAEHAPTWQRHILMNLPYIVSSPGLKTLFGKFKGYPGIIVSAGPSLDKNVAQLKYAKGHAVIICVDTALRTLINHGIIPDIVIAIDATEKNYNYYMKTVDIPKDTYLITGPAVYPPAVLLFSPNVFFSGFGHPLLVWIETFIGERGAIKLGGSVSTAGFDLAVRMGIKTIILVGQDLSFPEDKIYTKDIVPERKKEAEEYIKKLNIVWVEDIYGNKVRTTQSMWTWIRWFEYQIANNPDITCIDATEGGAKIAGTKIITLKEAIKEYCKENIDVKKVLDDARNTYEVPSVTNLLNEINTIIKDWSRVEMLCKEGEKKCERLLQAISSESKINKRAMKLWREIGYIYQRILEHRGLFHLGSWNLEFLLFRMEKALQLEDVELKVKTYKDFYTEIGKYCQRSVKELKESIERVNTEINLGMHQNNAA